MATAGRSVGWFMFVVLAACAGAPPPVPPAAGPASSAPAPASASASASAPLASGWGRRVALTEDELLVLDMLMDALRSYPYWTPMLPEDHPLRDPARRAAAVPAALVSLRRVVESAEFQGRYASLRAIVEAEFRAPPASPKPAEVLQQEQVQILSDRLIDEEQRVKALSRPKDRAARAAAARAAAKTRAALAAARLDVAPFAAAAREQAESFKFLRGIWENERKEMEAQWPANPRRFVMSRLLLVRQDTPADGDRALARTTQRDGLTVFVDPRDESRSPAWKAAYRAGPAVTAVVVGFIDGWLRELEATEGPPTPIYPEGQILMMP